jgi:LysR family transcriptional regulator, regulator for bpeEF and oprC
MRDSHDIKGRMSSIMISLSQFSSFTAVARNLSFAKAAREFGHSASSLAKAVARLETQLGVKLFHRTTRSVQLTQEGEALFARCAGVMAEIASLDQVAENRLDDVNGTLKVSAPVSYGRRIIVPVVSRLLAEHPELSIDLRLTDERIDLIAEGFDAVVRVGKLNDSRLVARKFDSQRLALCASPTYMAKHTRPKTIDDLKHLNTILVRMPTDGRDRPLEFSVAGKLVRWRPKARLRVDQGEAIVEAVLCDAGIAQLPIHMVKALLDGGHLVELLIRNRPPPLPVNVITPEARLMTPRVRALIDALVALNANS